jgi:hypothetical protein
LREERKALWSFAISRECRMARPFDHLVLAVHDLTAAAAFYARLGFLVGQRNRHPWGTENHIIQFNDAFLELIGIGEAFTAPAQQAPQTYSFAAFIASYLQHQDGLAMLVLRSSDALADRAAFQQAQIGDFQPFHFGRKARMPDGREVDVAFSLAFAEDTNAPAAGFFVCQHHYPQNFWNPAFQVHPNRTTGIGGVVMIAANPADHAAFLSAFAGVPMAPGKPAALAVDTGFGCIDVMSPDAYRDQFGDTAPVGATSGAYFAAMRLTSPDPGVIEARLKGKAIPYARRGERLIIQASQAFGCAIVFDPSAPAG